MSGRYSHIIVKFKFEPLETIPSLPLANKPPFVGSGLWKMKLDFYLLNYKLNAT